MTKRNIEAVYQLSPMQQGMLFHSLYAPESGVYFEQLSLELGGKLDFAAFESAWQQVVQRHPILRTSFVWKRLDKMLQVVQRQVECEVVFQDLRLSGDDLQREILEQYRAGERTKGFDLSKAPLMRLALFQTANDHYHFIFCFHHALLDGWSMPILLKEVMALYEANSRGKSLPLEPVRPYRDYIAWLQQQDLVKAEAFWRAKLKGFDAPTPIGIDRLSDNEAGVKRAYAEEDIRLSREVTARLQSLARQQQVTINTILQGAWAILLSRYSGDEDVLFGATVSGRPPELAGSDRMLGLFINTLPVRVRVDGQASVGSWLKNLQSVVADARQYEYSSLVQIQDWSEVPHGTPLFENILVFENYPVDSSLREQKFSLDISNFRSQEQTNYPLTVVAAPGETLPVKVSYDTGRFEPQAIQRMLGHLAHLLEEIAEDADRPVGALSLLTHGELQQILVDWNQTGVTYPAGECIHTLFEQQARLNSDAVAIRYVDELGQERDWTYAGLEQRANQLAHYLIQSGAGPGTLVGISVERSAEMIVAVLAVLKAGGAYVPMDPHYPADRLAFMIHDAGVQVLLTQSYLLEHLPENGCRHICLDRDWPAVAAMPCEQPQASLAESHLAYVIYTSGSTGKPKGVMVPHRALVNHARAMGEVFKLGPGKRVLQYISLSFDASAEEIFPTLTSGATLVVPHANLEVSGGRILHLCEEQSVNVLHLPVALWHQAVDDLTAKNLSLPSSLRTLLVGGESPAVEKLQAWTEACTRRKTGQPVLFLNAYGLTETTITTTLFSRDCSLNGLAEMTSVPIGKPIANSQVYVLDKQRRPVPVGVPGELYVGGAGVAQGYLNRTELTNEKFIVGKLFYSGGISGDWKGDSPDGSFFKTGDLVRWLPDGNLQFIGRVDDQVKLRGFRVELGEIEAALLGHPNIQAAVVVIRRDQLVAYYVPEPAALVELEGIKPQDLRRRLQETLPEYMIPAAFVRLASLPLSPGGKVDRKALPDPDEEGLAAGEYVGPRTPVEEVLCNLWAQILNARRVGVYDHFFDLGGHSLLATQLASRMREAFGIEIPLRELFNTTTVAGQAELVEAVLRDRAGLDAPPIHPVERQGDVPLSYAQQRLWFLDQLEPGNLFYNIPIAVQMKGDLNVAALERSLNEIVRRHEVLRTVFTTVEGKPVQVIASELTLHLPVEDLRGISHDMRQAEALAIVQAEARQPFNLATGPLVRGRILRLAEDEFIVLVTIHHIATDGWSMEIMLGELVALYGVFIQVGEVEIPAVLPELPIQYADFARWQRDWLQGDVLDRQLAYWKKQLGSGPHLLSLPTDHPRPAVLSSRGASLSFQMPPELHDRLSAMSREMGATLFMTLLAAFQALLYRYTGQEDIRVGTPIANRNRREIEGLIGFFVNTLVMRADFSGEPSFKESLKRVREAALEAYMHQDLPFEILVDTLQPQRNLSHTPLFQVAFSVTASAERRYELPGLEIAPLPVSTGTSKFDITLVMSEGPAGLGGVVEYNVDLFEPETIGRMMAHYQVLLSGIAADPEQPVTRLPLLTEAERRLALYEWNLTEKLTPVDRCAHELFEEQAARDPNALALLFGDECRTYGELDREANQLANFLDKLGVGPDQVVGISVDRSIEMMVAILGVMKAGGAYLPLDPNYPSDRLAFMMSDSQITVLLTQAHLVERLPHFTGTTVCLDSSWPTIAMEPVRKPDSSVSPDHLAYVIYTSGSTGRPKGAMLAHRGLSNLTAVQREAFHIHTGSRVLQFSPFSFDASVWETFMALANGATLVLAKQEILASGPDLVRLLREQGITNVTLPPSVLRVLPPDNLPALATVIAAGEACTPDIVARWAPGRQFFNAYGPTETTVCASMYACDATDSNPPPIGRPISNAKLYVVDQRLQPLPVGVPGELLISGVSVARGYLHRPDLSAEKFLPDPFIQEAARWEPHAGAAKPASHNNTRPTQRMYRSGDLVRYRPDGNLEFLGRIDQQVKVRGFRIELGEIETALGSHPAVVEAVVQAAPDHAGDSRLVAYIVQNDSFNELTAQEFRKFLRGILPEYMVPSVFMFLEAFPISPSGKVDRKALPAPDSVRPELETQYVAPRSDIERTLVQISAQLLGIERVGIYDNFFEMGGHSLLATQLISRVRDTYGVELPLRSLFENPTIANLAERIQALKAEKGSTDRIAELLARIDQLTDEEVRELLAAKRAQAGRRQLDG